MSLDQLIARLEIATSKLESLAGGAGGSTSAAPAEVGAMVEAFDEIINGPLKKFVEASNAIGGEIKEQGTILENAFKAQRNFIAVVSRSKKPSDNVLQELLKPTSDLIAQAQDYREKHRNNKDAFNHLSAISEGIPALGWVMVTPKPGPYVTQMKEAAEFYTNRVIKDFKDKDESHKNFARAFPQVLDDLANFVKKYHTTGLVWNPKGSEATAAGASSAPAPAAAAPAAASSSSAPAGGAAPTAGLFAAINQGGVTSGLKKVDKSQMTHKNPELRAGSVVKAVEKDETAAPKAAAQETAKPPKLELQGNKWAVEYQVGNKNIVIENVEAKQTAYVLKCTNSTIVIKGKINQLTLDGCKKTAVVIDSVISGIDLVNCQSCQIQVTGKAPTFSIDKTDGCQLYLSKEGLGAEIFTAKSSEINICIPGATEDSDLVECPVPDQFKTVWNGSKFSTTIVEHKG